MGGPFLNMDHMAGCVNFLQKESLFIVCSVGCLVPYSLIVPIKGCYRDV